MPVQITSIWGASMCTGMDQRVEAPVCLGSAFLSTMRADEPLV
jgi:hypothetical protein